MKKYIFIFLFALFLVGLLYQSFTRIHHHWSRSSSSILQSPFYLNILPITFTDKGNILYFRETNKSELDKNLVEPYKCIFAISPIFIAAFISILAGLFLVLNTKFERHECLLLSLIGCTLFYFFTFIDYLTDNYLKFAFYFLGFFINIPFTYFIRYLLGRQTPFIIALYFSLLFGLIIFLLYPSNASSEIFLLGLISLFQFFTALSCAILAMRYLLKKKRNQVNDSGHIQRESIKIIFVFLLIIGFCAPLIIFCFLNYIDININTNYNAFLFLPAFSVVLYIMLAIRFGLIFITVIINEFLFKILIVLLFSLLYLFFIGFSFYSLFDKESNFFIHLMIIISLLILLDPIKAGITFLLDRSYVKKNIILRNYLSQISYYFNNPDNLLVLFSKISKTVEEGLGVHEIQICFSNNLFTGFNLRADNIYYNDSVWKPIAKKKRLFSYPLFIKDKAKKLKQIFQKKSSFLCIAFQHFDVALIVATKVNQKAFVSSDIKFLRSIIKYGESLLQNYQFLLETTKIRRYQNELSLAATIQQKIIPSGYDSERIKLQFIIKPFQEVTGDYVDFFIKKSNEYIILLGDVSGHGLGSAYLMTMTHSMVRASVKILGERLSKAFSKINDYLVHNHDGSDFMSLLGVRIQIKKHKKNQKIYAKKEYAKLEFINAGQHPMLIYLLESKKLEILSENQHILGVVDVQYNISTHFIHENFRVFIYSDGLFEIFDNEDKIIGEKEVSNWIIKSMTLDIQDQKKYILNKIKEKINIMDDISFVVAEIKLLTN